MTANPLDDDRRAAKAALSSALLRVEREANAARLALALAGVKTYESPAVDAEQLDYALHRAHLAAHALDEARTIYLATHGRGRRR